VIPIWKVAAPAIDIVSPDIYMNDPAAYLKVLELYHRDDNALFIPETSSSSSVARFFFSALGLQAIGFSPFGLDYSNTPPFRPPLQPPHPRRWTNSPHGAELPADRTHDARHRPTQLRGQAPGVAEVAGTPANTLAFGKWNATVSYGGGRNNRAPAENRGAHGTGPGRPTRGRPVPGGRLLVPGRFPACRRGQAPPIHARRRGNLRKRVFKFIRILNGDETDNGLNLRAEPIVLRVSLGVY